MEERIQISSGVSNTCLFAPAPNYKLNKGFFLSFLFKPLGGHTTPQFKQESLGKVSFINYLLSICHIKYIIEFTIYMFVTEQKHSLHDLSTNLSIFIMKQFQQKVDHKNIS